jgi:hypothetical protein
MPQVHAYKLMFRYRTLRSSFYFRSRIMSCSTAAARCILHIMTATTFASILNVAIGSTVIGILSLPMTINIKRHRKSINVLEGRTVRIKKLFHYCMGRFGRFPQLSLWLFEISSVTRFCYFWLYGPLISWLRPGQVESTQSRSRR